MAAVAPILINPLADVEIDEASAQQLVESFDDYPKEMSAGVASIGDAAAYALVWEWGNVFQYEKGPNTVKGINPDGSEVWLSIQAPRGWIAVNEQQMWKAIENRISAMSMKKTDKASITNELEKASIGIAQDFLELLKMTVPVRSGDLLRSLQALSPGDELLADDDTASLSLTPTGDLEIEELTLDEGDE